MQNLNDSKRDPRESEKKKIEARVLLSFAMQVCVCQHELGDGTACICNQLARVCRAACVELAWSA